MANYADFYERFFKDIKIGDTIIVNKDGDKFIGVLAIMSEKFITVQLKYYRQAFMISDFFIGQATVKKYDENEIDTQEAAKAAIEEAV